MPSRDSSSKKNSGKNKSQQDSGRLEAQARRGGSAGNQSSQGRMTHGQPERRGSEGRSERNPEYTNYNNPNRGNRSEGQSSFGSQDRLRQEGTGRREAERSYESENYNQGSRFGGSQGRLSREEASRRADDLRQRRDFANEGSGRSNDNAFTEEQVDFRVESNRWNEDHNEGNQSGQRPFNQGNAFEDRNTRNDEENRKNRRRKSA